MNISAPDAPHPDPRCEYPVVRFLAWLINPPVETLPRELRVLRWLLRATVVCLFAFVAGEMDLSLDSGGMGGDGNKNPKAGKPPA